MANESKFPVVCLGASAGGVPALQGFFQGLPDDSGMAFVVVTHLSPDRESLLHEVLARYTDLPVLVVADGMAIEPNRVYVMPSGATLAVREGRLRLREVDRARRERKPIDVFLSSLAQDQGEYAVAIILSGGDGDGTLGAKAVREANGLTIAQAPDESGPQQPSMPESAIASGVVDLAIPVHDMGHRLVAWARGFKALHEASRLSEHENTKERERAHVEICDILTSYSGHDFSGYKSKTFFRRLSRRMHIRQIQTLPDYIELLKEDLQEVSNLFSDLLINVTNFFRDTDAFALLEQRIIPKLFEGKTASDTVRVWIPGCSTGEEAYSLAVLLREYMQRAGIGTKAQIFATDIDEAALTIARAGRYPGPLLEGIDADRLHRFFKADGASYVVTNDIRELCIFSPHSLIRDPPFSRMDLVSCRNLLIYFGPEVQRQVIPTFHYSLKPGGYLFLGTSESIGQHTDLFEAVDKKQRIFQSREHASRLPRLPGLTGPERSFTSPGASRPLSRESAQSLRGSVEARVLEKHMPAHVLVNTDADIVYYSAGTGRYLEPPQGSPSRHLLSLARKGLRADLRAALNDCATTQQPALRQNIVIEQDDGRAQAVDITVESIAVPGYGEPLFLVVFQERGAATPKSAELRALQQEQSTSVLERELRDLKEKLQSTVEEYETALEELKSSNEELVSVNEEVQSSNEELEASKEETQSLNEELNTINAELNGKVEELDRANSDLKNLFESTQVATIFLDQSLVIRTFTPAAAAFFNLRPGDIGRPLAELSSQLDYPTLREDMQAVLASGTAVHQQLARDSSGKHYLVKLLAYRGGHDAISGVVLTLVDVTALAEAELRQQTLVSELNHRVKNMLAVVASVAERTLSSSDSVAQFRKAFLGRLGAMNKAYAMLSKEQWKDTSIRDVFTAELEPFGAGFQLSGPDIRLKPQPSLSLALAVHELATNAAKYGALSVKGGRLQIGWQVEHSRLSLQWREIDGPPVRAAEKTGFGFELLHGEIEYRMQGKIHTIFHPDGLEVQMAMPL